MTNLKILLKNNLNLMLGRLQGKKERKPTLIAFILLVLGGLGIFALYSYQAYSMFKGLGSLGLNNLCLFHAYLTALSVMVIIGVMRVSGNTKTSDSDLLLSLPIKKRDIIISKTINKYFFDLFFSITLVLPYIVLYQIFTNFNLSLTLLGILSIFLLPLLSVGISYILDFLVTRLFNRFKYSSFIKSLFSVFIFIIVLSLLLIKTFFYGTVNPANLSAYFSDRFFSNMFLNFVLYQKPLSIIGSLCVTILPFVLGLILYSINFGKTFSKFNSSSKKLVYKNTNSVAKSLLKKELSTYLTTPAWIVNTIIGPIFVLVLGIIFSVMGLDKIYGYLGTTLSKDLLCCLIAVIFCALSSTTIISCSSLSLEGKNFWILKSSPINEKTLLFNKGLLQVLIFEPFIILSSLFLTIFLKLSLFQALIILLLPSLCNTILAYSGVLLNLIFPNFNFEDETKVVKQSISALLTMLLGLVLTAILVGIYFLFKPLNIVYISIIGLGVYVLLLTLILIILFTYGIKKFRKL